jgi:broad specificity phosphatase PhoE
MIEKVKKVKLLVFLTAMFASTSILGSDIYSVYLVRHAEKDRSNTQNKDPRLTPCGLDRAQRLAEFFQEINLQAIYSTDYERTRETASPVANSKNLAVEIYDPSNLNNMLQRLRAAKQNALVIGHSNTTSVLAGLLTDVDLADIDEQEYDRLYQVVVNDDDPTLQLLHQAFQCS